MIPNILTNALRLSRELAIIVSRYSITATNSLIFAVTHCSINKLYYVVRNALPLISDYASRVHGWKTISALCNLQPFGRI